ncbi:MAG TPA: MFS transporter [Chloroflexia bacterium]|nr:MFS transporter [Chloroflexia bacterium]
MDDLTLDLNPLPPPAPLVAPPPGFGEVALGDNITAPAPFDRGKAVRYSVANLGASVIYSLFNFGMPLYLSTYPLPPALIGLLANERSFVGAFIQPLVGRLSDRTRTRFGRRRPFFLVGIPLMSGALLALATHPPLWAVLAIMAIAAFFLSVAWDPYIALMADLFTPTQRGRVGGLLGVGSALGTIIFLLIALNLWEHNEFLVFLLCIGLLVLTWAYTFFTVQEPPLSADVLSEPRPKGRPDPVAYFKSLAKYPEAAKYTLAVNFFWVGTGGALPFITLFAVKALGASEQEAFILPLMATVTNALFAVPAGFLADRFSKKAVMTGGMLLFGSAGLIGSQSQNLLQATIILGVIGIGNAAMAQVNPMITDLVPRKRTAEFIGLISAVFSFAQPIGSVLAGVVVTIATGMVGGSAAYRWTFIFSGAMVLLAAACLQLVKPERAVLD